MLFYIYNYIILKNVISEKLSNAMLSEVERIRVLIVPTNTWHLSSRCILSTYLHLDTCRYNSHGMYKIKVNLMVPFKSKVLHRLSNAL
jgi:hypothetical protein